MLTALLLAAAAESPAIALERELSPLLDETRVAKGLDALAESAKKRLAGVEDPAKRLESLMKCLTQEHGYTPGPADANLQELSLSRVMARGRGAGETLAVIYWSVAERLGIRLIPVYAPDRLLLRWEEGPVRITVDAADKSVGLTDAAYRKKLSLPEQGPYLDPLPPEGVEAFLRRRRAEVLLAAGRREAALADAEKAAALDPSRPEHHLALARTRWTLGDEAGARKALALSGERPEALILAAELALAGADVQAAGDLLDRAVSEASDDALKAAAHAARARLRAFLGRSDLAKADLDRARALRPSDPRLLAEREAAALDAALDAAWSRRASAPVFLDPGAEVSRLLAAVRTPDEKTRMEAQRRLSEMGPRAIPAVKEALKASDKAPRLGALLFLASAPNASCMEELLASAGSDESEIRLAALSALGNLAEQDEPSRSGILGKVRGMLEGDADAEVRRRAATVLVRFKDPSALAYFRGMIADKDPENRRQAALSLGRLDDRASVPLLVKALADEEPRVRARAAQSLGLLGDEAAVPDLLKALRDESRDVRRLVQESLRALTKQDWGDDADKWDDWWRSRAP